MRGGGGIGIKSGNPFGFKAPCDALPQLFSILIFSIHFFFSFISFRWVAVVSKSLLRFPFHSLSLFRSASRHIRYLNSPLCHGHASAFEWMRPATQLFLLFASCYFLFHIIFFSSSSSSSSSSYSAILHSFPFLIVCSLSVWMP